MTYNAGSLLKLPLAYCFGFGFLLTFLLLSRVPAYAEWTALGTNHKGMTAYVDPDTIHRNGDLVKMWTLHDYKTTQTVAGNSFLSGKLQSEYDCAQERIRRLSITEFSGNMGSGKVVYTKSHEGEWSPVLPNSLGQRLWQVACGKK